MLNSEQLKWGDPSPAASGHQVDPQQLTKLRRTIRVCGLGQWLALILTILPSLIVAHYIYADGATFSFWGKASAIVATLVGVIGALSLGALRRRAQLVLLFLKR